MNERFKQLESQCWEPRQYGPLWFNSTKFAELIVRECGNYMNSRVPGNLEVAATVAKMKTHFGVKP